MRITINTGTDHELYNCHMRACMLYEWPGAMVEVQVVGEVPELWISDLNGAAQEWAPTIRNMAVKAFNKAEACNPYAVEALGDKSGAMKK